jgi:2-deoxy-D-gluconate 3-dehydrogenase
VDLSGKVAIVTGGSRGIGAAVAQRLLRAGSKVAVVHASPDSPLFFRSLKGSRSKALAISGVDVSRPAQVKQAVRRVIEEFGDVDILVNSAGVYPHSTPTKTAEVEWDRVIDVNLKGAFLTSREVAKMMIRMGHGGKIVNISSIDAFVPEPDFAHYDASKAGLLGLTRSLALNWGKHGITVNAIAPGLVDAPGIERDFPKRVRSFRRFSPLASLASPDDVANAVLFLSSKLSDKITGQVICIDSGVLLSGYMSL